MFTLYQCKPAFQNWLRPVVHRLATWGVTPNQVTVAALVASGAMGLAITLWPQAHWVLLGLPVLLLGRMALNAIDGMLAREHNLTTPLGCLLNEVGDVLSDSWLYLPFCFLPAVSAPWIVTIVLLAILSEMVGVLGLAIAQKRAYEGPMGKSDRAFVFGSVGLALGLGLEPAPWLTGLWLVVIGLQLWTLVNRTRSILREASPCL
jgi:CDP-diacylglycerol--glycerol-3-phosphate 3-phosphatidyltransferase